jgi:hypothetical protein
MHQSEYTHSGNELIIVGERVADEAPKAVGKGYVWKRN